MRCYHARVLVTALAFVSRNLNCTDALETTANLEFLGECGASTRAATVKGTTAVK
jgi:hypothetical protein